jgi:hypothetical protein
LGQFTARHRRIIVSSSNPEKQIRPTHAKISFTIFRNYQTLNEAEDG